MIPRELMEELRYLEIYTRKAVRDHHVGDYRSPLRGRGFEFDHHKRYQHGDDYRQIDWNATARMGYPYVKRDFEEKELSAVIIADLSRSMDFASGDGSKRELLVRIAATLAFSAATDNMKVGLLGFTDRIELDLPLKKGPAHSWRVVEALWDAKPRSTRTNFALPFEHLLTRLTTSTLLFLISDFVQLENSFHSHALRHLARKHDLMPVVIEDQWDTALPGGQGFVRLRDAESGGAMVLNLSRHNKSIYRTLMLERKVGLQRSFYNLNLDHLFLRVDAPYLESLLGFFLARKRRK
ncbi:MAG: hypothetical protein HW419_470 [Deltaproteobacteria bacterium]|nr:hypothetical protein [Deltaproteobacteria bacterium]